jgi:hypothetical protein
MAIGKASGCGARIRLDNREVFSLARRAGCREIVCTEGVIWVTFPGDPQDYLLNKGERMLTEASSEVVISGIGKAEFSLIHEGDSPPRPAGEDLTRTYAA